MSVKLTTVSIQEIVKCQIIVTIKYLYMHTKCYGIFMR